MRKRLLKISNIRKTIHYLQKNGVKHAYYAAKERIEEEKQPSYVYQEPTQEILKAQRKEAEQLPYRLSLVVPAYETKEVFLRELLDSVLGQSYENWELVIADASSSEGVRKVVEEYQKVLEEKNLSQKSRDESLGKISQKGQICYIRLPENRGISDNTNLGIEAAAGDYIGLLDHDDFLSPDALFEMAKAIQKAERDGEKPILLYSDEDKYENNSHCYIQPNIKNEFNLDLILSNNYICHLMFLKAEKMKALKLRKAYDGAQDYDLVLRVVADALQERKAADLHKILLHIPKVLYHWRCHENSTAENTASKSYAYEAGKAALEEFSRKQGWKTQVRHSLHLGFYDMLYQPDIFTNRPEIGIIGGRILDKNNKITSGIYGANGEKIYYGLHKEYSGGSTHKAVLKQDCAAVDIRCVCVRRELWPVFEEIMGIPYRESGEWGLADVSSISCDEEGYRKLSMELGKTVRQKGYLVLWNPEITWKNKN